MTQQLTRGERIELVIGGILFGLFNNVSTIWNAKVLLEEGQIKRHDAPWKQTAHVPHAGPRNDCLQPRAESVFLFNHAALPFPRHLISLTSSQRVPLGISQYSCIGERWVKYHRGRC